MPRSNFPGTEACKKLDLIVIPMPPLPNSHNERQILLRSFLRATIMGQTKAYNTHHDHSFV